MRARLLLWAEGRPSNSHWIFGSSCWTPVRTRRSQIISPSIDDVDMGALRGVCKVALPGNLPELVERRRILAQTLAQEALAADVLPRIQGDFAREFLAGGALILGRLDGH